MQQRATREREVFRHLWLGLAGVAAVTLVGTLGFMLAGRLSVLDALYHTIGLMTTSGGFEQTTTAAGKLLASFVVVAGIGALFYTLGAVAEYVIEGHFGQAIARRRMDRKIDDLAGHGIICGYGRVGRRIAQEFAEAGQPFVVIDKLETNAAGLAAADYLHLQGDATVDQTLLEAGVRRARSLLAATDDDTENIRHHPLGASAGSRFVDRGAGEPNGERAEAGAGGRGSGAFALHAGRAPHGGPGASASPRGFSGYSDEERGTGSRVDGHPGGSGLTIAGFVTPSERGGVAAPVARHERARCAAGRERSLVGGRPARGTAVGGRRLAGRAEPGGPAATWEHTSGEHAAADG